jgi:hypothetical protein
VDERDLLRGRGAAIAGAFEPGQQDGEPLLALRMVPGRMEARERGVGQDVDRTISLSSSSPFAAPAESPRR